MRLSTWLPQLVSGAWADVCQTKGNLDDEQRKKLKQIWLLFFELLEKHDKEGAEVAEGAGDADKADEENDPKKSGIPTDDKAKDEAKKLQERKDMEEMLDKYGSRKLREAFWQFTKGDNPVRPSS